MPDHRRTIETLLSRLDGGDVRVLDEVFHDDAVLDWPQFGERIRGGGEPAECLRRHPEAPPRSGRGGSSARGISGSPKRRWTTADGGPFAAVFVFELRGERIARETAYWALPSPPAEWRARWVERLE